MTRPWVTVVGNGVAGFACARRLAAGGAGVTLVGPGLPCDRPPLSKRALVTGRLPYLASAAELAASGIDHLDAWAADLDVSSRRMTIRHPDGRTDRVPFEHLVWATGLQPVRPPIPGIELAEENAYPAGLERLAPALNAHGRDIVVIGAGLIGTETAASLSARHRVTLIERADRPLERFHPLLSAAALEVLDTLGVAFAGGSAIERIEQRAPRRRIVRLTGGHAYPADIVIAAAGVSSTLPGALGEGHHLDVDESLAMNGWDAVWACGDLARYPHPRYGRLTVPHWDNALAGGRHVAAAILGERAPFVREPYWFSDIGPLRIQLVGNEAAAVEWRRRDELHIGLDGDGSPCCVLLMNAARRLADARRLLAA